MLKNLLILFLSFFTVSVPMSISDSLEKACYKGDIGQVRKILSENKALLAAPLDKQGASIIHHAAVAGYPDIIELLLNNKPDLIDLQDARGNIPFVQLFLGIFSWRSDFEREKRLTHFALEMQILRRTGPTFEDEQKLRVARYKQAIDLFVTRGARFDIPNQCGKRWTDIPGLDEELSRYAQEKIKQQKDLKK